MKKREKGVAILSALIVMSVVICLSVLLFSLIITFSLSSRQSDVRLAKSVLIHSATMDFVDNAQMDHDYDYHYIIVPNEQNLQQKALIFSKNDEISLKNIYFYVIYDFDENKILASQSGNFYIESREEDGITSHYLAGIVRFEGENV